MKATWPERLLRARQLQEDAARERLAQAQTHASAAAASVRQHDERIVMLLAESTPLSITALLAASEARARAAATLGEAEHESAVAQDQIVRRSVVVTAAAQSRRSAEKLIERAAAAEALRLARVQQRELDEMGARVWGAQL